MITSSENTTQSAGTGEVDPDRYQENHEAQLLTGPIKKEYKPFWRNLNHELVLLLSSFAFNVSHFGEKNLYLDRACEVNLNHTLAECNGNDTELTDRMQAIAADYVLYNKIMHTFLPALITMFAASWSDKYGRKPLPYLSLFGLAITSGAMVCYALSSSAPLYFTLIAYIPFALVGGFTLLQSNVYAMATDSVIPEMRTTKIALLSIASGVSVTFGSLTSGLIFKYFGYVPLFSLSFGCRLFAVMFFYFMKDEGDKVQASLKTKVLEIFSFLRLKEMIKVVLKKRPDRGRMQIILLCFASLATGFFLSVFSDIQLYFCKKIYGWSFTHYTNVITVWNFSKYFFTLVTVLLLNRVLKKDDCRLGILGVISMQTLLILNAFAYHTWMFYLALFLGVTSSIPRIVIYAKLPKLVSDSELVKVFSVVTVIDTMVSELSSLMSTQVYKASIEFFPGLPLLIEAVLLTVPLSIFIWFFHFEKSQKQLNDVSEQDSNVATSSCSIQT